MANMNRKKNLFLTAFVFMLCISFLSAKQPITAERIDGFFPDQSESVPSTADPSTGLLSRRHTGAVLALAATSSSDIFFSAGSDGFLTVHNADGSNETWQISDIPLKAIAIHPDGNLIAIYESDGFSIHRISVWDWKNKNRLYAKRFRDSIISLSWSAKGNYLMIGNTSVDGIAVLEKASGSTLSFFKTAPGMVSLSVTGASESSMVTFGPSGHILYTDLAGKKEKASYEGEKDLSATVLLNNNLKIAGYKEGSVFVIDATSGKTVATYPADDPVMTTKISDALPAWFEKLSSTEWTFRKGPDASRPFSIPNNSTITSAVSFGNQVVIGTMTGKLYAVNNLEDQSKTPILSEFVENSIRAVDDIVSDGSRLFLLSSGSVFISPGPGRPPVFAFDKIQANRLSLIDDSLIFWSTNRPDPVMRISIDGETRTQLYQPKEGLHSLSVNGNRIAAIEGTSTAVVFSSTNTGSPFTFSGAGLQDASLISQDRLIVSKSATRKSPYPLILINTLTGETVPVPVSGELCFGIRQPDASLFSVNCFIVRANAPASSTELISISFDPQALSSALTKTAVQYADEDLVAAQISNNENILTNLGKGPLVEISPDGQQKRYDRGYALPSKISLMDQFIATLNYDGSLTWFDRQSRQLVSSAMLTSGGMWIEQ